VLLLASCTKPPGRRAFSGVPLSREDVAAARAALTDLRTQTANEQWAQAKETGLEALAQYPGFEGEPELMWLTAQASSRLGDADVARRLWVTLARDHPDSPFAAQALWSLARFYADRGHRLDEARVLISLHDRLEPDSARRETVRQRLRQLIDQQLSLDELDTLHREYPKSFVASRVSWAAIQRASQEERPSQELGARLEDFLRSFPESRYDDEAEAWLARLTRSGDYEASSDLPVARVDRIGVLCPLSGEYSALGQALYDGALLAIEEWNRASGDSLAMVGLDTRGDEVVAVQAAKELIEQDQVIAIVGALTSSTTVAVGVLCQERRVPLISPTATNENIHRLGSYVFQTNLTQDFETRLVAQVAVRGLLRQRFAILYPDDEDGRTKADVFAREVESMGAKVVASQAIRQGQTDFGDAILRVRTAGPEALFLPMAPSEMRLLAPQLVFNDLRAQLLGPSNWNNSALLRQAGDSMDRAVVPSDQAMVSQEEAEHFTRQWRRRFPQRAASPFAEKSYFAMRRVLESLDPSGEDTRERLRNKIESAALSSGRHGESPFQKLRVLTPDGAEAFPVEDLPGLQEAEATALPDSSAIFEDLESEIDPGDGQP
jgi:branched-chain amino acid transport system substrate-binding protein